MAKRPGDSFITYSMSPVIRRLTYGQPSTAFVPIAKRRAWKNRLMNKKPNMYGSPKMLDVPYGCESPCKIQQKINGSSTFKSSFSLAYRFKISDLVVFLDIGLTIEFKYE